MMMNLGFFDIGSLHRKFVTGHKAQRIHDAVDWETVSGFRKELSIKADTYPLYRLFEEDSVKSPSGRWEYLNRLLPKGS